MDNSDRDWLAWQKVEVASVEDVKIAEKETVRGEKKIKNKREEEVGNNSLG